MADRPIPFSAPMVRALLAGRKTQTRRILPNPEYYGCPTGDCPHNRQDECNKAMVENTAADLRYAVGDRLYVREEYYQRGHWAPLEGAQTKGGRQKWAFVPADDATRFEAPDSFRKGRHNADPETVAWHKRLGRFMPRKASRLTLIVTDVRVERLQDCSEADAMAEGVEMESADPPFYYVPGIWPHSITAVGIEEPGGRHAVRSYAKLWNHINGEGAWDANPWVVAVSFDVRKGNIDG